MYINDPFEKILPPKLEDPDIDLEEEPRDYHEFFYDDLPEPGGKYAEAPERLYTGVCHFDQNGEHLVMARNCPHFNEFDELGRSIRPGWTVQQGR